MYSDTTVMASTDRADLGDRIGWIGREHRDRCRRAHCRDGSVTVLGSALQLVAWNRSSIVVICSASARGNYTKYLSTSVYGPAGLTAQPICFKRPRCHRSAASHAGRPDPLVTCLAVAQSCLAASCAQALLPIQSTRAGERRRAQAGLRLRAIDAAAAASVAAGAAHRQR